MYPPIMGLGIFHGIYILSKSESVKFSLIESVICFFTDSSVKKYFSLLNQLIFTDSSVKKNIFHSEIGLIYSNLFLAIWISQISLILTDWNLESSKNHAKRKFCITFLTFILVILFLWKKIYVVSLKYLHSHKLKILKNHKIVAI